jgi:hypothetical protein
MSGAAKVTFTEQDLSFFIAAVTEGKNCIQITARKTPGFTAGKALKKAIR